MIKAPVKTASRNAVASSPRRTVALLGAMLLCLAGCQSRKATRIAVIPQTEVTSIWEDAHGAALDSARSTGTVIDWKAPMREDDIEAQIALVDRVVNGNYQGLILAPNQAVSLISPVRRAIARGIRTAIIGSPLRVPAQGNLIYVLNDDVESGRLAARRVASRLNGHGNVAMLGINPDMAGVMIRARAFEESLNENYPGVRIVERRMGTFSVSHEQQVAEDSIRDHRDLNMVVALMPSSVEGSLAALKALRIRHTIKVIGFDSAVPLSFNIETFAVPDQEDDLDCVIQQNTRAITQRAFELIQASLHNQMVPSVSTISPVLITRESIQSNLPELRDMVLHERELIRSRWSPIQ